LALDSAGDLFIADWNNDVVREVNQATHVITTVAGNGNEGYSGDGSQATAAELNGPEGLAVDSAGDLFIADYWNNVVREVNRATGVITTVAGNGTWGYSGDCGQATAAELKGPDGLAVDASGDLFIADYGNSVVREVNRATGVITTVAGSGTWGYNGDDGQTNAAEFPEPDAIAVDTSGNLFIADYSNNVVREVNQATGEISTVAGNGTYGYNGDNGPATTTELWGPMGVAIDSTGALLIVDMGNCRVRRVAIEIPTTTVVIPSVSASVVGQSVTFTANVSPSAPDSAAPTGTVSFLEGGTLLGTAVLDSSGVAAFTTSALSTGSDTVTASYSGDAQFISSSGSTAETVSADATITALTSSANPSVFGRSVTFTATVSANLPGAGTPTGNVTFKVGGKVLGTGTLDATGKATFSTSNLALGSHAIAASYSGDANFISSASIATQEVKFATTLAVTASANPSAFGESVVFTATVSAHPSGSHMLAGTVVFSEDGLVLGTGVLDATGKASLSTSALSVGDHTITAAYSGDADFTSSTASAEQEVNVATTTAVTVSANPSVLGQAVTFTATVSADPAAAGAPTGNVTFAEDGTVLGTDALDATGKASFSTSALSLGGHTITAVYWGDTNFAASSGGMAQMVDAAATTTTVTALANPDVFGQPVTFTATVNANPPGTGTPTGNVTFADDGTVLGVGTLDATGRASFSTSALSVGGHTITAAYWGDANFIAGIGSMAQTVNRAATTVVVSATKNPSPYGWSVTFTATVRGSGNPPESPGGTVVFKDGSTILGTGTLGAGGKATFTTSSLDAGTHAITACYEGDLNFVGCTSPKLTETVAGLGVTVGLTSSRSPSASGQSVVFTVTVGAKLPGLATPTGTVVFKEGENVLGSATLDASGAASFTTSGLTAGKHAITAYYLGDEEFAAGSKTLTQTVTKSPLPDGPLRKAAPPLRRSTSPRVNDAAIAAWTKEI
jgi:sugar lactone lactonase YvrE